MKMLIDKWGRKKLVLAAMIMVLVPAGFLFWKNGRIRESDVREMPLMPEMSEDVITASGLTAAGMLKEEYELDFLETPLYVEEAYLSVGETVEAGDAVCKVSDETLKQAREELETAATEAGLAYRKGMIDYETQKLETEGVYAQAEINKEYAQAEYDSALEAAGKEVSALAEQVEAAQELYDEYKAAVESNYYYTYYKVEELKQVYYENFTYLMELYEKWGIDELEDQYPNVSSSGISGVSSGGLSGRGASENSNAEINFVQLSSSVTDIGKDETVEKNDGEVNNDGMPEESVNEEKMSGGGMSGGAAFYDENSGKLSVYQMMDELVQQNGEEYEAALENYERDTKTATASLESARSELAKLQAELEEAQLDYEKQVIEQKTVYETTIAESENSESVYNTAIKKLAEELEALKDEKEETEENLVLFEETIGDGYFYTASAGTVVMNMVRAGNYLSGDSMLLAYSDAATVTVAASVDQKDIAQIAVGDSAYVIINEYGSYEGTVISINPLSSSESRSAVTYTVTVELSGEIEGIESNLTSYVYFGMSEEMMSPEGAKNMGERPEEMKQDE